MISSTSWPFTAFRFSGRLKIILATPDPLIFSRITVDNCLSMIVPPLCRYVAGCKPWWARMLFVFNSLLVPHELTATNLSLTHVRLCENSVHGSTDSPRTDVRHYKSST